MHNIIHRFPLSLHPSCRYTRGFVSNACAQYTVKYTWADEARGLFAHSWQFFLRAFTSLRWTFALNGGRSCRSLLSRRTFPPPPFFFLFRSSSRLPFFPFFPSPFCLYSLFETTREWLWLGNFVGIPRQCGMLMLAFTVFGRTLSRARIDICSARWINNGLKNIILHLVLWNGLESDVVAEVIARYLTDSTFWLWSIMIPPWEWSIVNDYLSRLDNTKNSDKGNEIFRIYINAIVSIFFSKNYIIKLSINSISKRHIISPQDTVIVYRTRSLNVDLHNNGVNSANLPFPFHSCAHSSPLTCHAYAHERILLREKSIRMNRNNWNSNDKTLLQFLNGITFP